MCIYIYIYRERERYSKQTRYLKICCVMCRALASAVLVSSVPKVKLLVS